MNKPTKKKPRSIIVKIAERVSGAAAACILLMHAIGVGNQSDGIIGLSVMICILWILSEVVPAHWRDYPDDWDGGW